MNNTFKLRIFLGFIALIVVSALIMVLLIAGGFSVAGEMILWSSVIMSFLFMLTAAYLSSR
ncbi:hypothetical protein [Chondrinema litorale]|uniref:hypothetical protein n=1 Tax=Chondrinema litorale TaxID=2994555 RepID=UPI0025436C9A|nr:hypothetical protein [Chondrinema litorale]UZR93223.1 hypothetical protein OQ292_15295 [Chondrinema litorale]